MASQSSVVISSGGFTSVILSLALMNCTIRRTSPGGSVPRRVPRSMMERSGMSPALMQFRVVVSPTQTTGNGVSCNFLIRPQNPSGPTRLPMTVLNCCLSPGVRRKGGVGSRMRSPHFESIFTIVRESHLLCYPGPGMIEDKNETLIVAHRIRLADRADILLGEIEAG